MLIINVNIAIAIYNVQQFLSTGNKSGGADGLGLSGRVGEKQPGVAMPQRSVTQALRLASSLDNTTCVALLLLHQTVRRNYSKSEFGESITDCWLHHKPNDGASDGPSEERKIERVVVVVCQTP